MKLFEHTDTKETLDRLPALPPGVEVPDDISGIHPPRTLRPTTGGVRWMRWLTAIVVLGAAGVVAAVLLSSSDTEQNQVDQTEVDYMVKYGTDNPAIVAGSPGPGTVEIVGSPDFMELYGTDNPVFVPEPSSMELYGTDNPVFVPKDTGEYWSKYGTDNPVFVSEPTPMDLYGTDNPVLVPEQAEPVDTGEWLRLYGTDNPVFEP